MPSPRQTHLVDLMSSLSSSEKQELTAQLLAAALEKKNGERNQRQRGQEEDNDNTDHLPNLQRSKELGRHEAPREWLEKECPVAYRLVAKHVSFQARGKRLNLRIQEAEVEADASVGNVAELFPELVGELSTLARPQRVLFRACEAADNLYGSTLRASSDSLRAYISRPVSHREEPWSSNVPSFRTWHGAVRRRARECVGLS